MRNAAIGLFFFLLLLASAVAETAPAAATDATYQALRSLTLGSESLTLDNFVLKRDAGAFTLTGTICFVAPVEGKVTGAVFLGSGTFELVPPLAVEKKNLSRLTGQMWMREEFEQLVLRFTDGTYDELKRAGKPAQGGCTPDPLSNITHALRKDMKWNLDARILQDLYGKGPGGLFAAFIKGKKYNGKELFVIDPRGVVSPFPLAPEEVMLLTWDENKWGVWAAFHLASEYASGKASSAERNGVLRITKQEIDTTIDKSGFLSGKVKTTFAAQADGLRVVPFQLYPKLRVSSVTDTAGQALKFIQEEKDQDADFWAVLSKPLAAGEQFTVVTTYAGKDALRNEGNGNYYLVGGARDCWYPSSYIDDYATYDMRFNFPRGLKLLASGTPVREVTEGAQMISDWRSDGPQTVAAFHIGKFRKDEKVVKGIELETYANEEVPDWVRGIQHQIDLAQAPKGPGEGGHAVLGDALLGVTLGSISTTGLMKKAMAEAELATQLYSDYFGPAPFKRLAMTQQTADNYGQSWPQLVWLPISYFFDDTIRHQLYGFDVRGYFKVVGPHEIAHQWWGHTVTWGSYRDQWMSEGFADASAAIFTQILYKTPQQFIKFWDDERELLIEKNKEGYRAIDAGPLTMGYRLNNSKVGNVTRRLIYPKGAYILHMIRMMMWDPKSGDQAFKEMMRDFVGTYRNRAATTEDFKAIVEKHMTPNMDVMGNRKMDWFFDEYVYGTALPKYQLDYKLDGTRLSMTITQSNVDENFRMLVPVYLELANGRVHRLGNVGLHGNNSDSTTIDLAAIGLKEPPKRVLLNYYDDVLCDK